MTGFGRVLRLSVALSAVSCTIIVGVDAMGWIPRPADELARHRAEIAESMVTHATVAANLDDMAGLRTVLEIAVKRHEDIISIGLRDVAGRVIAATRGHTRSWAGANPEKSTPTHMRLPIFNDGDRWANLEVRFASAAPATILAAIWNRPATRILIVIGLLGTLGNAILLNRIFRYLDPSQVVPARVKTALDAMSDGVVLVDANERIVLSNATFCKNVGLTAPALLGLRISSLGWENEQGSVPISGLPWNRCLEGASTVADVRMTIDPEDRPGESFVFQVTASPILDSWERSKGAIINFKDITELERNREALEGAMQELEKTQYEIRLRNEELQLLAQTDPLTGLANRRTFMDWFDERFEAAKPGDEQLSCIIVDIDHFKQVNDTHGHSVGDEVIRRVADALKQHTRGVDIACRYGGEEFCLALCATDATAAYQTAERLRQVIGSTGFARIPITVSLGISSTAFGARTPTQLIDQADAALYASKEGGRNRSTRFDELD